MLLIRFWNQSSNVPKDEPIPRNPIPRHVNLQRLGAELVLFIMSSCTVFTDRA